MRAMGDILNKTETKIRKMATKALAEYLRENGHVGISVLKSNKFSEPAIKFTTDGDPSLVFMQHSSASNLPIKIADSDLAEVLWRCLEKKIPSYFAAVNVLSSKFSDSKAEVKGAGLYCSVESVQSLHAVGSRFRVIDKIDRINIAGVIINKNKIPYIFSDAGPMDKAEKLSKLSFLHLLKCVLKGERPIEKLLAFCHKEVKLTSQRLDQPLLGQDKVIEYFETCRNHFEKKFMPHVKIELGEVAGIEASDLPCVRHSIYGIHRQLWMIETRDNLISEINVFAIVPSPADFTPYPDQEGYLAGAGIMDIDPDFKLQTECPLPSSVSVVNVDNPEAQDTIPIHDFIRDVQNTFYKK